MMSNNVMKQEGVTSYSILSRGFHFKFNFVHKVIESSEYSSVSITFLLSNKNITYGLFILMMTWNY